MMKQKRSTIENIKLANKPALVELRAKLEKTKGTKQELEEFRLKLEKFRKGAL